MSLTVKELNLVDTYIRKRVKFIQSVICSYPDPDLPPKTQDSLGKLVKKYKRELAKLQALLRSIWNARVEASE